MGAPKNRITLTDDERSKLTKITQRHNEKQSLVQRAKIILMADQDIPYFQIAKLLDLRKNTISTWTARWNEKLKSDCPLIERLWDLPRSGAPDKFTPEQLCKITAMACEPPEAYERPITHWTYSELADELAKQCIVGSISPAYLGRLLKKTT